MVGFILIIVVLAICGLLFGKADTKKELLNQVGLDLSSNRYETRKEDEFKKFALRAMREVVNLDYYRATDEKSFLDFMSDKLDLAINGRSVENSWGGYEHESLYLGVKKHYVDHAYTVVYRRTKDLKNGNNVLLSKNIDFSNKKSAKHYCEILWDKYQYPWPSDWMQNDGL